MSSDLGRARLNCESVVESPVLSIAPDLHCALRLRKPASHERSNGARLRGSAEQAAASRLSHLSDEDYACVGKTRREYEQVRLVTRRAESVDSFSESTFRRQTINYSSCVRLMAVGSRSFVCSLRDMSFRMRDADRKLGISDYVRSARSSILFAKLILCLVSFRQLVRLFERTVDVL